MRHLALLLLLITAPSFACEGGGATALAGAV